MFIVCVFILLISINASTVWSNGWDLETVKFARSILKPFNEHRMNIDLYKVNFNYYFQDLIKTIKPVKWFSEQSNKSVAFPLVGNLNNTISLNAYFFMDLLEMRWWKIYGFKFAFAYPKNKSLKRLLSVAEECYDPFKCSRDPPLNNFVSCYYNDKECFGSNRIYSYVYLRSFSMISCIESSNLIICFGRYNKPLSPYPFDDNDDYT